MDINDLGSIAEVIAALATVGTLLYLASQIRQSSIWIRINSTDLRSLFKVYSRSAIGRISE